MVGHGEIPGGATHGVGAGDPPGVMAGLRAGHGAGVRHGVTVHPTAGDHHGDTAIHGIPIVPDTMLITDPEATDLLVLVPVGVHQRVRVATITADMPTATTGILTDAHLQATESVPVRLSQIRVTLSEGMAIVIPEMSRQVTVTTAMPLNPPRATAIRAL